MIQLSSPLEPSILIICPWCYDCWARIKGLSDSFQHHYIPCTQHPQACRPYGSDVAGSLFEADPQLLDQLTPELLTREFQLTLSNLTKELA